MMTTLIPVRLTSTQAEALAIDERATAYTEQDVPLFTLAVLLEMLSEARSRANKNNWWDQPTGWRIACRGAVVKIEKALKAYGY